MKKTEAGLRRRTFLKSAAAISAVMFVAGCGPEPSLPLSRPNIILCMADDLGWGDVAIYGHPVIKTPHLDTMSRNGIHFSRFYAGAPLCSPTRGSCLTGRHPYRYGIFSANVGHLPEEELTLAEVLKEEGYLTGHFGKWHLGTLTTEIEESNRGGARGAQHFAPPWTNGFDFCFSTEAKVPTWDPMIMPADEIPGVDPQKSGEPYGTYYWEGPGQRATENLQGDDSRVIMDRALSFIDRASKGTEPFFAVVWFHAPHAPVIAGPRYREMYRDLSVDEQHYYGCITALDEQIGRLRRSLRDLGIAENTMVWFCSDNGPEGKDGIRGRYRGSAGPFRGRKRSLLEGGMRVPAFLEWPAAIPSGRVVDFPCSTSDYLPTILSVLGLELESHPYPLDGISLLPLITGDMVSRPVPIGFQSASQISLVDNQYKLYTADGGLTYQLFNVVEDPGEGTDLALEEPEVFQRLRQKLDHWLSSCKASLDGEDYRKQLDD